MDEEIVLETVAEIARSVREYVATRDDYGEIVGRKHGDETRKIDIIADKMLENILFEKGICARIISEEFGDRIFPEGKKPEGTFIFDPIDGSTNLSHNIPFFCTSLAYSPKTKDVGFDDIEMGAVACTAEDKIYHAKRNCGAYINGERIDRIVEREGKRVVSIYAYGVPHVPSGIMELQKKMIVRTLGSVALEVCMVAEGRIDAIVDMRGVLRGFDIAASLLILKESGGIITDAKGGKISKKVHSRSISIVAALDEKLHRGILSVLRVGQ